MSDPRPAWLVILTVLLTALLALCLASMIVSGVVVLLWPVFAR